MVADFSSAKNVPNLFPFSFLLSIFTHTLSCLVESTAPGAFHAMDTTITHYYYLYFLKSLATQLPDITI